MTSEGLIGLDTRIVGNGSKPAVPTRQENMKTKAPTGTARAVAVKRDDGRHAARVVAVSLGLLFALIFLLQAATQ
jgi:hypothetical protein